MMVDQLSLEIEDLSIAHENAMHEVEEDWDRAESQMRNENVILREVSHTNYSLCFLFIDF